MKAGEAVKMILLGMTVAFLAVLAIRGGGEGLAADHAAGGSVIALTVSDTKDTYLYLVNTESKHIALYAYDGNKFGFRASRSYQYDRLEDMNDRRGMSVKDAKQEYEKEAARR